MESCSNCAVAFQLKKAGKGYYRFSLEKIVPSTGKPAREELGRLTGCSLTPVSKKSKGQFLCPNCWSRLSEFSKYQQSLRNFFGATDPTSYVAYKRSQGESEVESPSYIRQSHEESEIESPGPSFKRPRLTSTPVKRHSKTARNIFGRQSSEKASVFDTIITAIRARQYRRAINGLYNASRATKRHFNIIAGRIVRKEVGQIFSNRDSFALCNSMSISSISEFSWDDTIAKASEYAPLLFNVLRGAVTTRNNEESMCRGKSVNLKPRIGTALALLLHARAPKTANFLQTLFSVQFWRGRLKRETIKQLSRLGLCVGYETTLATIDKIRSSFDSAALKLKADMEEELKNAIPPTPETNDDAELSMALSSTAPTLDEELTGPSDDESTRMSETILYSDAEDQSIVIDDYSLQLSHRSEEGEKEETAEAEIEEEEEEKEEEEEENDDDDDDGDYDDDDSTGDDVQMGDEVEPNVQRMDMSPIHEAEMENVDDKINFCPPSFTMCWDNVGKKVVTRRPTENVKNTYINMALGYAAVNRVPSMHLAGQDASTIKAEDIPLSDFLPGRSDTYQLRGRMSVIVGRILTRQLKWFGDHFGDCTVKHIVHEHTLQSVEKSILFNLGAFDEDPSSTQGAIGIYERLQKYVPVHNDKPYPVIVYGDGLSCERGNDAHRARVNGLDPFERLEGLQPAVQEFHKEMLLLQDFFDEFFKGSSASDRGTLSQIRNMFNYRQVKADIADNFTHAWELMCLVVEAFVCLLAIQLLQIDTPDGRPSTAPSDTEQTGNDEKSAYFEKVCDQIVSKVWQDLHVNRFKNDSDDGSVVLCCGEDTDEDMIGCECRSSCPHGEFFHYSCVDVDPNNIPVPWYCSHACKNKIIQSYSYCICKEDLGTKEPMVGCSAESQCTRFEWYHMRCLGMNKPPKGKWFCCDACKKGKRETGTKSKNESNQDHVFNYSIAVLWRGLNLLCRRDAVREADGEAMISFWKFDLCHFFSTKHPKYVILAHRLIASINGWLPERLRFDLMHNRTVNYGGGIGRNLPMDFMNEVLNRLFKDLLESAKGRYTDKTIQRCSQIVGPFGEALDQVFDSNVIENEVYRHRRRAQLRDKNVRRLVEFLQEEHLFLERPGRQHKAFAGFQMSVNPANAGKFPGKIKQLSKRLDRTKQVVLND